MGKLTKAEAKAHREAVALLDQPVLSEDEKDFVMAHWQESDNANSLTGAFFTPAGLAHDFALEIHGSRVIDLCAGAGYLSLAYWRRTTRDRHEGVEISITCVEMNPDYIEVGRKLLPEATWIQASVFDVLAMGLGEFDCAYSNPPFGKVERHGATAPRYTGPNFEYHVIDIAAHLAPYGAFIVPQGSAPFAYSGQPYYRVVEGNGYKTFHEQTGIELTAGVGIDTSVHIGGWHQVSPATEVVRAEFERPSLPVGPAGDQGAVLTGQPSLFEIEALEAAA